MNQAASATNTAGSTATAGYCPMFANPFFVNTYANQAPLIPPHPTQQCFLGAQQTSQIQPLNSIQPPATSQQQQLTVSRPSAIPTHAERSQQPQRLQDHPNQSTNSNNIDISNINNNYGNSFTAPTLSLQHQLVSRLLQQQPAGLSPLSAQHIARAARATLNEEALNALINEQFQATVLLNQLIASNQFTSSFGLVPMTQQLQQQQQQQHNSQSQQQLNSTRSQFNLPNQVPIQSAQQVPSFVPQIRPEQVSGHQQFQQAPQSNNRVARVPVSSENLQTPVYRQSQHVNTTGSSQTQPQAHSEQNVPAHQVQAPPLSAAAQPMPAQQQSRTIPTQPFYTLPQLDQAIALLAANPQVSSNIFNLFSNTIHYFQNNGMRLEQHAHHNPAHHFHNLHGTHHHHHHHHHGPNGPVGQDTNIPTDSLATSESKPKGLNRAEIDSLTHYIHIDEKDSRTCVICLSKFELKAKIRPLSCNHAFHAKCVDKWLRANRTCPICRRDALKTCEGKIKRI